VAALTQNKATEQENITSQKISLFPMDKTVRQNKVISRIFYLRQQLKHGSKPNSSFPCNNVII